MSENCAAGDVSQQTNPQEMGVQFIELEEIIDVPEEQHTNSFHREEEKELMRRQSQAERKCRELRECHDGLYEHGLIIEELILQMEAEKKSLTFKIKEYQDQVANIRKKRRQEEEEEEEGAAKEEIRSQYLCMRELGKWIKILREKNNDLKAKFDQLSSQKRYGQQIKKLSKAAQEFKVKLKEIQETLRRKDEEIHEKCRTLSEKMKEVEELFNIRQELRQDKQNLQEELSSREEQKLDLMIEATKNDRAETQDEEHEDEPLLETKSWWDYGKSLWRGVQVAGVLAPGILLPVGIMTSMAPVCDCPDPDCNLWSITYDLLESYMQLHHTHTPLY